MSSAQGGGELISSPLRRWTLIGDTDGHGITLISAVAAALMYAGIPPSEISIISHFATNGPATTARGDVTTLLKQVSANIPQGATVFILDVPVKNDDIVNQIAALKALAEKARVIIIDHATHSDVYAGMPVFNSNIDLRLKTSALMTFLDALLQSPTRQVYDLAVLGAIMDADMDSFRSGVAATMAAIVRAAGESEVPVPTIDDIRAQYPAIVAFDSFIKFGKVPQPAEDFQLIGNCAHKAAYLAVNPIDQVFAAAAQQFSVPSLDEIKSKTTVIGNSIAVYQDVAPKGQGFKYASLMDAAMAMPVNVVLAEGFTDDKLIAIIAPDSFTIEAHRYADFTRSVKDKIFSNLKAHGISDDSDFPRGDAAYSIGIAKNSKDEALKVITDTITAEFAKFFKEKALEQIVAEEFTVITADRTLAASMARIVAEAVKTAVSIVKEG